MARKALSYFADERGRNNNPNFFINMKDEDLRRQVKRIMQIALAKSLPLKQTQKPQPPTKLHKAELWNREGAQHLQMQWCKMLPI